MQTNNLTKSDIAKNLSKKTGFSLTFSKKLINDYILILTNHLINENLIVKDIGVFKLIKKRERLGRNPITKEEFIISARKSISFSASKKILAKINL